MWKPNFNDLSDPSDGAAITIAGINKTRFYLLSAIPSSETQEQSVSKGAIFKISNIERSEAESGKVDYSSVTFVSALNFLPQRSKVKSSTQCLCIVFKA